MNGPSKNKGTESSVGEGNDREGTQARDRAEGESANGGHDVTGTPATYRRRSKRENRTIHERARATRWIASARRRRRNDSRRKRMTLILCIIGWVVAAYAIGALVSEYQARNAYVTLQTQNIAEALRATISESIDSAVENALQRHFGLLGEAGRVDPPPPSAEERAITELSQQSMDQIRQGFMDEYGMVGKALDDAMEAVQLHYDHAR